MYAVIGLGNPEPEYGGTRHNVGFDTINCIAERNNVKLSKLKHKSIYGEFFLGNEKVFLVKPQTYMNRSGEAVLDIHNYYKIPIENIIVIYDDIDIEFGKLRIRKKGSAGSHNGMKSVIYQLQSDQFPRVRIGIGKPKEEGLVQFVLGKFTRDEKEVIDSTILKAAKAVESIIQEGIDKAMSKYNG
ncbi:aminoacyl-tRNA hydrolase [Thermohalobacter berrensis]|uniref:Peptidyl-tRNA hydrolase n=1 Tax=Thermohalobacter berrensis TaxID=99594 RepID=A0A419T8X9_9FIRM|nr:aminoacyl-tRNA hydrolase [Thermohalobacter berrensis]RKD33898.1 aminoacyl-tRNA hydrolase [Thermohalobacter berrensis]